MPIVPLRKHSDSLAVVANVVSNETRYERDAASLPSPTSKLAQQRQNAADFPL